MGDFTTRETVFVIYSSDSSHAFGKPHLPSVIKQVPVAKWSPVDLILLVVSSYLWGLGVFFSCVFGCAIIFVWVLMMWWVGGVAVFAFRMGCRFQ